MDRTPEAFEKGVFRNTGNNTFRVVFWGSTAFAIPTLEYLIGAPDVEVTLIVTRQSKPAGRKLKPTPTQVARFAIENYPHIRLLEVDSLKGNESALNAIRATHPDAYVVNSFGRIIPERFLELVKYPLCVHPSQLPLLRGPSPIRTALLNGMTKTGITLFRMVAKMDAGDILLFREAEIHPEDDFGSLRDRLSKVAIDVVRESLALIRSGEATFAPQNEDRATFTKLITYKDTLIDFSESAERVLNKIRAFSPDMGAVCEMPNGVKLKLLKAKLAGLLTEVEKKENVPGKVIRISKEFFTVACGTGVASGGIDVYQVQPENRRVMSARDLIVGRKISLGDILKKPSI